VASAQRASLVNAAAVRFTSAELHRAADDHGVIGAGQVVEVVSALGGAGVTVWVDGGWGVDALLGKQTGSTTTWTWWCPSTVCPWSAAC